MNGDNWEEDTHFGTIKQKEKNSKGAEEATFIITSAHKDQFKLSFQYQGKTLWVKEAEYNHLKAICPDFTKIQTIEYVAGGTSPIRAGSGSEFIDGYQVTITYNK